MDEYYKLFTGEITLTEWQQACKDGDMLKLGRMLQTGIYISSGSAETGLFLAAMFGKSLVIMDLLSRQVIPHQRSVVVQCLKAVFYLMRHDKYPSNASGFQLLMVSEMTNYQDTKMRILLHEIERGNLNAVRYTLKNMSLEIGRAEVSYILSAIYRSNNRQILELLLQFSFPCTPHVVAKTLLCSLFEEDIQEKLEIILAYRRWRPFETSYLVVTARDARKQRRALKSKVYQIRQDNWYLPTDLLPFVDYLYVKAIGDILMRTVMYLQIVHAQPVLLDAMPDHFIGRVHIRAIDHLLTHCAEILDKRQLLPIANYVKKQWIQLHGL